MFSSNFHCFPRKAPSAFVYLLWACKLVLKLPRIRRRPSPTSTSKFSPTTKIKSYSGCLLADLKQTRNRQHRERRKIAYLKAYGVNYMYFLFPNAQLKMESEIRCNYMCRIRSNYMAPSSNNNQHKTRHLDFDANGVSCNFPTVFNDMQILTRSSSSSPPKAIIISRSVLNQCISGVAFWLTIMRWLIYNVICLSRWCIN